MPDHEAREGIAIQHGTGINADYECLCPICGEESGVDDLGVEYECQVCGNIVIFREENIKTAESEQESIKTMSQEEHEAIHRTVQGGTISPERLAEMIVTTGAYEKFPCGLRLSEIRDQDIETALQELKEYRESELRPANKFLTNTLNQQMQHIEQEFNEAKEVVKEFYKVPIREYGREYEKEISEHLAEELTDLKTSCETMLAIMGYDAAARRAEVRKVNEKNGRRHYFE